MQATSSQLESSLLQVYTDGALKRGVGSWAFVVVRNGKIFHEASSVCPETDATRMEIQAAIEALQSTDGEIEVLSDSRILVNAMSTDLQSWKNSGWIKPNGKPHPYRPQLMRLYELCAQRRVHWRWLRAHAGNIFNERCDELCRLARA